MTDETGCERKGKRFGGCRFEPRYDVGEPNTAKIGRISYYMSDAADLIEACRSSTYVHDVCVRCGQTAVRPPPPTPKEKA